jgi:hypothetical protein
VEWSRYESLLNLAFAGAPVSMVCPYDTRALAPDVLDAACRTHPHFVQDGRRSRSAAYAEPADFLAGMPAPGPIVDAAVLAEFSVESDLGTLRREVIATGSESGLTDERVEEAVLAVNELVTNALLHGLRPVVVRLLAATRAPASPTPSRGCCRRTRNGWRAAAACGWRACCRTGWRSAPSTTAP